MPARKSLRSKKPKPSERKIKQVIVKALKKVKPEVKVNRVYQAQPDWWVLCFQCKRSFVPTEPVWLVDYVSPYGAVITVAFCPECEKKEGRSEESE